MMFRLIGSLSKSIAQALAPACLILLALVLYTGFVLPVQNMRGWASWLRWLNPVSYGFESLMLNEFHGRNFPCAQFVPSGPDYEGVGSLGQVCSTVGAQAGETFVSGTEYLLSAYGYTNKNKWRNVGILIVMTFGLMIMHLIASELVAGEKSKGEVLVFSRRKMQRPNADEERRVTNPSARSEKANEDVANEAAKVERQTAVFHWSDLTFDIKVKGETRRLLNQIDGWVKPGTLTALMGVSGAGKTTLLDVLASRTSIGVITGKTSFST
jgi:ATP-binding cassette, subfamily G (WHITE), member 2, PDR